MNPHLDELVALHTLERIEENLFRGQSQDLGWGTVFGGQVLGQARSAAWRTIPEDRAVHSLHAYFLRPGDVRAPIVYDVDRIRDGGSFTTRRVVAIQAGRPIFNLAASFQQLEAGFEHQDAMPEVPPPEALPTEAERLARYGERLPRLLRQRADGGSPFEHRLVVAPDWDQTLDDLVAPPSKPPYRSVWFRAAGALSDAAWLHAALLAYASDFMFLGTSLLPHGVTWLTPGMQVASIDHVMWYHQPARVDDWLLYSMDSPAAHGARGLVRGRIFTRQGALVATVAQEGLIRRRPPPG